MSRSAHRNLFASSALLAMLVPLASLSTASPAAAADDRYCHDRYRACLTRSGHRTCDRQYNSCMAYSGASAAPAIIVGGFPRGRRHHKDYGKPKTPPPKAGGGGKGGEGPKGKPVEFRASSRNVRPAGSVVRVQSFRSNGGGRIGGGGGGGGGRSGGRR
jgi:hypothetical protein